MDGVFVPGGSTVRASKPLLLVGVSLWGCGVAASATWLWRYENTPGASADASPAWPADVPIPVSRDRATLVMTVHPHCPCSRASLAELAVLAARAQGRFAAHVLFYKPENAAPDWEKTDLWRTAAEIPGVRVWTDEEGRLARRFDAATSGQTFLYDSDGRLRFSGGVTVSRGHVGDNPALDAILESIHGGRPERRRSPVFGCSLATPARSIARSEVE
jgi:hypothetical protein